MKRIFAIVMLCLLLATVPCAADTNVGVLGQEVSAPAGGCDCWYYGAGNTYGDTQTMFEADGYALGQAVVFTTAGDVTQLGMYLYLTNNVTNIKIAAFRADNSLAGTCTKSSSFAAGAYNTCTLSSSFSVTAGETIRIFSFVDTGGSSTWYPGYDNTHNGLAFGGQNYANFPPATCPATSTNTNQAWMVGAYED